MSFKKNNNIRFSYHPTVRFVSCTSSYLQNIGGGVTKCYETEATTESDLMRIIQHCIDAGHLSILEHAYATFDIECSLAVLGQLARHRHLSPTVKSSRGGQPYDGTFMIPFITPVPDDVFNTWTEGIETAYTNYLKLIDKGMVLEDASYLLPKAAVTKVRLTGSLRAWYEYLPKRLCRRAMPEHRRVAERIAENLHAVCPEIFPRPDVLLNCGNCSEKGCEY